MTKNDNDVTKCGPLIRVEVHCFIGKVGWHFHLSFVNHVVAVAFISLLTEYVPIRRERTRLLVLEINLKHYCLILIINPFGSFKLVVKPKSFPAFKLKMFLKKLGFCLASMFMEYFTKTNNL